MKNHRIKKLTLSGKRLEYFTDSINSLNYKTIFTIKIQVILITLWIKYNKECYCVSDTNNQRVIRFKTKGNLD